MSSARLGARVGRLGSLALLESGRSTPWAVLVDGWSTGFQQRRTGFAAARWYKEVSVIPNDSGGWGIWLDGRALRTPGRNPLLLPNLPLAMAVSAEWQWQKSGKVRTSTMPLNTIAAMAIDEPKPRETVIDNLVAHLDSDSVLCRHAPGALASAQTLAFDPVIDWAQAEFKTHFTASDSIFGTSQTTDAALAVRIWLGGLDRWELAVANELSACCRSLLLGAAVMQGQVGIAEAIVASRLEEVTNIEDWGFVEGGHDIDVADMHVRMAAPSVFIRLLRLSSNR